MRTQTTTKDTMHPLDRSEMELKMAADNWARVEQTTQTVECRNSHWQALKEAARKYGEQWEAVK